MRPILLGLAAFAAGWYALMRFVDRELERMKIRTDRRGR